MAILAVGAVILSSCGEDAFEGNGVYNGTTISSFQTRLYTKAGEVKDRSAIDRFVKVHGDFDPYREMVLSTYKYQATYLDSFTVVVKSLVERSTDTMTVLRRDGLVIWESRDTVNQYTQHLDAFKYKRIHYTEVPMNGVTLITKYLDCMILEPSGNDLLMPITFYCHRKGSNGSFSERIGRGNNEFNPDYVLGFGDTDTVLVYRYTLRLRQQ